jgi:hypothetical protein
MPRLSIDFSKTVIYKLVCNDLSVTELYVGFTTDFIERKYGHKSKCKSSHLKVYEMIRDNGGWDNWSMIEIEKYPCKDGNEARARERHWYEELHANMNVQCPIRSNKEYRDTHKENKAEYDKGYKEKNKEKSTEYNKEKINCEWCNKQLSRNSMRYHLTKACILSPENYKFFLKK